jgi:hypothetical protein
MAPSQRMAKRRTAFISPGKDRGCGDLNLLTAAKPPARRLGSPPTGPEVIADNCNESANEDCQRNPNTISPATNRGDTNGLIIDDLRPCMRPWIQTGAEGESFHLHTRRMGSRVVRALA